MIKTGKVLFYNEKSRIGTIISIDNESLTFSIDDWHDFDLTPSAELKVEFTYKESKVSSIISLPIQKEQENLAPLEGVQTAFREKKKSLKQTLNIANSISKYFDIIDLNIQKRAPYKKVPGRLDYLLVRRFLWTTFNNLKEIDLKILTPDIKTLSKDLKAMASIYDDFINKTKFPVIAYEDVFLASQKEYLNVKDDTLKMIEKLNHMHTSEERLAIVLTKKKEELKKKKDLPEYEELRREYKVLNGTYVDLIHTMGELSKRYKHDIKLVKNFEKKFQRDFYTLFKDESKKFKESLVDILCAQAFLLDSKLWKKAKKSEIIIRHFAKSGIKDELNTKTYLKYYLETLDNDKSGDDTQKLIKLYEYLCKVFSDTIMIVVSSAQDAIEYEAEIKKLNKSYDVKAFIDERAALQWAIKNGTTILVLEDKLSSLQADEFLKRYKKLIYSTPKIILLGEKPKSSLYRISTILSKGVSPRIISQHIKELLT